MSTVKIRKDVMLVSQTTVITTMLTVLVYAFTASAIALFIAEISAGMGAIALLIAVYGAIIQSLKETKDK